MRRRRRRTLLGQSTQVIYGRQEINMVTNLQRHNLVVIPVAQKSESEKEIRQRIGSGRLP